MVALGIIEGAFFSYYYAVQYLESFKLDTHKFGAIKVSSLFGGLLWHCDQSLQLWQ